MEAVQHSLREKAGLFTVYLENMRLKITNTLNGQLSIVKLHEQKVFTWLSKLSNQTEN